MSSCTLGPALTVLGSVTSMIPPGLSVAAGPPLSLDTESESPWPSWNSLVLFGLYISPESLVLCLLENLGFQRRGSLPENKMCNCLVRFCILVVVGEEIFKSRIKDLAKDKACLNFSFAFPCALSSSLPNAC